MCKFFFLISVCTIIVMRHLLLSFLVFYLYIFLFIVSIVYCVVSWIDLSTVEVSQVHKLQPILTISSDQNMFQRKTLWKIALNLFCFIVVKGSDKKPDLDSSKNIAKRTFCRKYDGYEDFCSGICSISLFL